MCAMSLLYSGLSCQPTVSGIMMVVAPALITCSTTCIFTTPAPHVVRQHTALWYVLYMYPLSAPHWGYTQHAVKPITQEAPAASNVTASSRTSASMCCMLQRMPCSAMHMLHLADKVRVGHVPSTTVTATRFRKSLNIL